MSDIQRGNLIVKTFNKAFKKMYYAKVDPYLVIGSVRGHLMAKLQNLKVSDIQQGNLLVKTFSKAFEKMYYAKVDPYLGS